MLIPASFSHWADSCRLALGLLDRKHILAGQLGFEPFGGSGSQVSAAEQLDRRCYAIEIEPRFCDVIVQRWQKLTGKEAKRRACR